MKNILRSLDQTFQTVNDRSNFWKRYLTCIGTIKIRIGTHYWDVKTYTLQEQVRKYCECTVATYLQNIQSNLWPFEYFYAKHLMKIISLQWIQDCNQTRVIDNKIIRRVGIPVFFTYVLFSVTHSLKQNYSWFKVTRI